MVKAYFHSVSQMLLFIWIAPGVIGLLRFTRARLQGRQGPKIYQPYLDLWKLCRKKTVIPETASWLFLAVPFLIFSSYSFIGLIIPIVYLPNEQEVLGELFGSPLADLIIIAYILVLNRFMFSLAGFDSASPFGGMGGSREMFVNVICEPTLLLSIYALAINAHTTSLPGIIQFLAGLEVKNFLANASFLLVIVSLSLLMLAETGRIPFDNPDTHLELTMMGKAIGLEYSGALLALLEWAEAMRLTFFLTLISNLLLPFMVSKEETLGSGLLYVGFYILRLMILIFLLAVWELTRGKLRLRAIINPAAIAFIFSVLAVVVAVTVNYFM